MAMVVFCRRTLAFLNQPLCSCLVLAWPGSVSGEGKQIRSNSSVVVRVSEQQRASPREGDWPFVFFHPTDLSRTISVHSAAKSTPPLNSRAYAVRVPRTISRGGRSMRQCDIITERKEAIM